MAEIMVAALALAAPVRGQEPARYRAVVDLVVGDIDGRLALTHVAYIVPVGDRVYLSQSEDRLVRIISRDGEPLGEIGGSGEGPGELQGIDWMGLVDDALALVDLRQSRITHVDVDDGTIRTRPFPDIRAPPPLRFGFPLFAAVGDQVVTYPFVAGPGTGGDTLHVGVLVGPNDRVLDSLPGFRHGSRTFSVRDATGSAAGPRPIFDGGYHAMAPDGSVLVMADHERRPGESTPGGELLLVRYDTRARRTDTLRTGLPRARVPDHVADSVEAVLLEQMEGAVRRFGAEAVREAARIPREVPALDALFVADDGDVWLRERRFDAGPGAWRVYTPTGELRAQVEVPQGLELKARNGPDLWAHRQDGLFVSYVVRLHLEPSGG